MIFLAFQSYDESRSGADAEATLLVQQVETAQFLPKGAATELTGELVCYGRSVAGIEWDAIDAGTLGTRSTHRGRRCSTRSDRLTPQTATEQSAYDRWMDQTAQRQEARNARLHGAQRIIPLPPETISRGCKSAAMRVTEPAE
jgi:hypothetical protein